VPDFCTCGAQLPPDARFCHKCAKPQYDYMPAVEEPEAEVQPAVAKPPVLLATPEISFHNALAVRIGFIAAMGAVLVSLLLEPRGVVLLPVAFVLAGFLAVFLYSRRTGQTVSVRGGARMGWITGVFVFAIIAVMITITTLTSSDQVSLAKQLRSQVPANDPNYEFWVRTWNNPMMLGGILLFGLAIMFVIVTSLPMLGGALGAKVLEKR
jgi:hypothetical protein